jgi:hypothetical protein
MSKSSTEHRGQEAPFGDIGARVAEFACQTIAQPEQVGAWSNLAVALRCSNQLDAAIAIYRRALRMEPHDKGVMSNLGGALRAAGRLDEATSILRQAAKLNPEFLPARFNLGLALEDSGALDEALAEYDFVLSREPGRRDATMQKAFTLLKMGRLLEGFAEYEKRLHLEPRLQRKFAKPMWDGQSFQNQTLLLYSEQGLGDTFQFVRYARYVKELGGSVILECPRTTMEVAATARGIDVVVAQGDKLPAFDYHASLMSLPYLMGTTLETIPAAIPYLCVPDCSTNRIKIAARPGNLRVGIAWKAGHDDVGAHSRNIPLKHFIELLQIPGINLYSLQVGGGDHDPLLDTSVLIENVGAQLETFVQTAEAIDQLDLIISTDTALIHLAAAMGKPTWVVLPYASEWRWLQHRNDSPWYPTVRLYRPGQPNQWHDVFKNIIMDLEQSYCRRT